MLESTARESRWELRCYPSTIVKATVGGFLGGGSGGIGSVAHGCLRDFHTVRAFEAVSMESEPRILMHEGATYTDPSCMGHEQRDDVYLACSDPCR